MAAVDGKEIEVKIKIDDVEEIKDKIRKIGCKEKERAMQDTVFYDFPDKIIKQQDKVLRIRNNKKLTYKGPQQGTNYKSREEIELEVDGEKLRMIFENLGMNITMKSEKYRTKFKFDNGDIVVDETPIGNYIEIEGDETFIDEMTIKLGFTNKDHIIKNYGQLAREYYKSKGIESDGSMVFK